MVYERQRLKLLDYLRICEIVFIHILSQCGSNADHLIIGLHDCRLCGVSKWDIILNSHHTFSYKHAD